MLIRILGRSGNRALKCATCIAISVALTSCSSTQTNVEMVAPADLPVLTETPYSDSIDCFGDMLSDYRTSQYGAPIPLRIAIINVVDSTDISTVDYPNSEIPSNYTDIALGAASRIGGPIRLVHVPRVGEIIDAARFSSVSLEEPFLSGFEPTHYRADTIQLYGALTAYDRFEKGRERNLDGSFIVGGGDGETNIELSQERIVNQARMTMDFRAAHVYVGDIVNHSSSTNSLTLYQRSLDRSFGISVDGNSIGYLVSNTLVDARHYAIRVLVERGLIETIGKYLGVPYWRCFPETGLHTAVKFDDIIKIENTGEFVLDQPAVGSSAETPASSVSATEPEKTDVKNSPLDQRDEELIWSVVSDFLYGEYLENNSRKRIVRPNLTVNKHLLTPPRSADLHQYQEREQKRVELEISEGLHDANGTMPQPVPYPGRDITIKGRHDKLNALVGFYKQHISSYQDMSDKDVLIDLTKRFMDYGILNTETARSPMYVYLALWLNLPVQRGSRWIH